MKLTRPLFAQAPTDDPNTVFTLEFQYPVWIPKILYFQTTDIWNQENLLHMDAVTDYYDSIVRLIRDTNCAIVCLDEFEQKDPERNFCLLFTDSSAVADVASILNLLQSWEFDGPNPWLSYKFKTNNNRTLLLPKDHPRYGKLEMYMVHV